MHNIYHLLYGIKKLFPVRSLLLSSDITVRVVAGSRGKGRSSGRGRYRGRVRGADRGRSRYRGRGKGRGRDKGMGRGRRTGRDYPAHTRELISLLSWVVL